jgi:hypothetical protein
VGIVGWRLWQPYEESFLGGTSSESLSARAVASLLCQLGHLRLDGRYVLISKSSSCSFMTNAEPLLSISSRNPLRSSNGANRSSSRSGEDDGSVKSSEACDSSAVFTIDDPSPIVEEEASDKALASISRKKRGRESLYFDTKCNSLTPPSVAVDSFLLRPDVLKSWNHVASSGSISNSIVAITGEGEMA